MKPRTLGVVSGTALVLLMVVAAARGATPFDAHDRAAGVPSQAATALRSDAHDRGAVAGRVAGTFTTTIDGPSDIRGTWTLTFAKNGAYRVVLNGNPLARGSFTALPRTITLREPTGCGGTGTYAWTRSGATLSFVRMREAGSCQVRAAVLSHRFIRVR